MRSDSTDAAALPEGLEDQLYDIHFASTTAASALTLDQLCEQHPQYAEELRRLSATLSRSDQMFGRVRQQLEQPCASERIGPFVVRSVLGQGGFGTVYLADQLEPVQRTVALKVLKTGSLNERALYRFESEQQVLALLQHACIATVYDAGVTPEGRHYFAMEAIAGKPVTTWCDAARMPIAARLQLFLRICGAIQYAHQRGVVHRDIKPSNVLVHEEDGHAVPKVIDFGVAKLLSADDQQASEDPMLTRAGAQIGTPGYMSPEQAVGGAVDTRTDVYALGVLLGELLTGHLPFARERFRSGSFATLATMLRVEEPNRPSQTLLLHPEAAAAAAKLRCTSVAKLTQQLRADLDWVVLKAISRESDDRYASVAALAEDVERYLRNEPVSVREGVLSYWLRKFVTRHRFGVMVAAGICVTILSAIIGLAWALNVVDDARQEAVDNGNLAAEERDTALNNSYAASMTAAQFAMESGRASTAVQQLRATDPSRRGWEWRHLAAQSAHQLQRIDHMTEILDVAWLDDERFLGFESAGEIAVWSAKSGQREHTLAGWLDTFRAFEIDRERGLVVIGGDDGVGIWDYLTGRQQQHLLTVATPVHALAWSKDRRTLFVSRRGGRIDRLRFGEPDQAVTVHHMPPLSADATSLRLIDDEHLLLGLSNGLIEDIHPETGTRHRSLVGHTDIVDDMLLDAARNLMFSASLDTTVRVWDLATGSALLALPGQVRMRRLALSADGQTLYGSGGWTDNRVIAWHTDTFRLAGRYNGHDQGVLGLALNPSGQQLLTSGRDHTLRIWPSAPPASRLTLDAGRDARDLAVDPSGDRFASAAMDGIVTVWNAHTLKPDLRLETDEHWAGCALGRETVYVAGSVLAAFRIDGSEPPTQGTTQGNYIEKMAVDPDERWLVGGHNMRTLVWQLPGLELKHVLALPAGTGRVIHDAKTKTFLLGCADSTLRWLDPATGVVVKELRLEEANNLVGGLFQHDDLLGAGLHRGILQYRRGNEAWQQKSTSTIGAAILPDGSRIATAGSDHAIRLWDTATMQELMVLGDLIYGPLEVAFVDGGNRLIALSHRWDSPTYIYVWSAPPQAQLPR